jgi:hypothetical protein
MINDNLECTPYFLPIDKFDGKLGWIEALTYLNKNSSKN